VHRGLHDHDYDDYDDYNVVDHDYDDYNVVDHDDHDYHDYNVVDHDYDDYDHDDRAAGHLLLQLRHELQSVHVDRLQRTKRQLDCWQRVRSSRDAVRGVHDHDEHDDDAVHAPAPAPTIKA